MSRYRFLGIFTSRFLEFNPDRTLKNSASSCFASRQVLDFTGMSNTSAASSIRRHSLRPSGAFSLGYRDMHEKDLPLSWTQSDVGLGTAAKSQNRAFPRKRTATRKDPVLAFEPPVAPTINCYLSLREKFRDEIFEGDVSREFSRICGQSSSASQTDPASGVALDTIFGVLFPH